MIDTHELERRLAQLGETLAFDEDAAARLPDRVLARLDEAAAHPRRPARVAALVAAAIVLAAAVLVATPTTRHAIARWFGLAGVDIGVDPALSLPAASTASPFEFPGPGESRVVLVDGHQVLVSTLEGEFDEILLTKSVGGSDQVREVDVDGRTGIWVSGDPHEVMYRSSNGQVLVDRVAANTLLWQDGATLRRVEGFEHLADALAFAITIDGT